MHKNKIAPRERLVSFLYRDDNSNTMHLLQSKARVWYAEDGGNPQYDKDMEWELLEPKLIEKHVGEGFLGHPITKDDVHLQLLGTLTTEASIVDSHPNIVWVHDANTQPFSRSNK
jgi:hypothetical protein|tara:strand:- start:5216 stop:5560 length:345 start_codon:yes stop_codon:yes gene_type:complete